MESDLSSFWLFHKFFCTGHSLHWYWNIFFWMITPLLWHLIFHSPLSWHFSGDCALYNYLTKILIQVICASKLQPFFLPHFIFLNLLAWESVADWEDIFLCFISQWKYVERSVGDYERREFNLALMPLVTYRAGAFCPRTPWISLSDSTISFFGKLQMILK